MDESHNVTIVAHHEAAHAVVAVKLGLNISSVELVGEEQPEGNHEWNGRVTLTEKLSTSSLATVATFAFAGPLAEIKAVASGEYARQGSVAPYDVLTKATICPESLPQIMDSLMAMLSADERLDEWHAKVCLQLNGAPYHTQVFLGASEDDIRRLTNTYPNLQRDQLERHLKEAKDLVDDPKVWGAIMGLAKKIAEVKAEPFLRKSMDSHVNHLVRDFLGS